MRRRILVALRAGAAVVPLALVSPHAASATTNTTAADAAPDVEYEVLPAVAQDPLGITVAPDGRVIWTEREGTLNVLKPDGTQIVAGRVPVSAAGYGRAVPCALCVEE